MNAKQLAVRLERLRERIKLSALRVDDLFQQHGLPREMNAVFRLATAYQLEEFERDRTIEDEFAEAWRLEFVECCRWLHRYGQDALADLPDELLVPCRQHLELIELEQQQQNEFIKASPGEVCRQIELVGGLELKLK